MNDFDVLQDADHLAFAKKLTLLLQQLEMVPQMIWTCIVPLRTPKPYPKTLQPGYRGELRYDLDRASYLFFTIYDDV